MNDVITALSVYFPVLVAPLCIALCAGALWVRTAAERSARIIRRDADVMRELLDRWGAEPRLLAARIGALPSSPLGRYLDREIAGSCDLFGRFYRTAASDRGSARVLREYMDIRSLDAWPNVFVGIGLLLTFIGLSLSLWNAAQGAASGDVLKVTNSVTSLLLLSAVKFTTSLVALFCSIVLGLALRRQRSSLEENFHELDARLERVLPRITLEAIAAHALSDAYCAAREESMARAIAHALSHANDGRRNHEEYATVIRSADE
jgi:hypothetical protein